MNLARLRPKLLLALFTLLSSAVVVELVLRASAWVEAARKERALEELGSRPPPGEDSEASLADLLRPSRNPRLVYELRPNLRTRFKGKLLTTDERGFRSTGSAPDATGAVTVLGIGDSLMFGWGVADGETFLARLPALLAERFPRVSWSTSNAAVPGYNTAMEVEALLEKGLSPQPDLVILSWVDNDLDLPSFIRPSVAPLTLDRSFLIDWIVHLRDPSTDSFGPDLARARHDTERYAPDYFDRLTPQQRDLVGPEAVERALARLAATARARGFEVLVAARGRPPKFLARACRKLELPIVVSRAYKERFASVNGLATVSYADLSLSPTDPHPSELGHRLIAFGLSEFLAESGIARRLSERVAGDPS